MAFDLSTARPLNDAPTPKPKSGGFDMATARPVEEDQESSLSPISSFDEITQPWESPAKPKPDRAADEWKSDFRSGTLSEMGTQIKAGLVSDLPEMTGNATRAFSGPAAAMVAAAQNSGFAGGDSALARMGAAMQPYNAVPQVHADAPVQSREQFASIKQGVEDYGRKMAEQGRKAGQFMNPDMEGRGEVAKAFIHGSRSIGPSLAPMFSGPLAPAAAFALFGGDQYTQTFDRMKAAGKSDEEANAAALKTGFIQGGGEAIANKLTMGALGATRGVASESMGRMLGSATDSTLKTAAKQAAKANAIDIVGNAATEVAQDTGTEAVERNAGLAPTRDYGDIAKDSGGAGAAMAVMLAPLGLAGHYRNRQRAQAIDYTLANPASAPADQRQAVVDMLYQDAKDNRVPDADVWYQQATQEVASNKPVNRADVESALLNDGADQADQDYLGEPSQSLQ
ncbi:MAG TPA: hypothetical protein PKD17_13525, partial [Cellvibrionaceae bacterium]|nr:hypothetical protein [Cellvibrionaceae bacterium]